jgi:hypothetical protein
MFGLKRDERNSINLLLAALVAAASLYSIAWYVRSPLDRPTVRDYEALSGHLHRHWRDGDVLAIAPFWAERIREYAGDLGAGAVINPPDLANEDLSRRGRLWLLSVFDYADKRDLLGTLSRKYKLAKKKEFGRLVLYLFELPAPVAVSFDFLASVDKARVFVQRGSETKECATWRDRKWVCAQSSWENVGPTILDIADNPRRCIWAHPVTNGVVNVEYKGVPLSKKIVGYHGLTTAATRVPEGAQVTLDVLVDGRKLHTSVNKNRKGWNRFEVDTAAMAGTAHDVTFQTTTPRDGMRHFCFTADARD